MKSTNRITHLKDKPQFEIGHIFKKGDIIGIMGSTGQSTGPHVHTDWVKGYVSRCWRQKDMGPCGSLTPLPEQLLYILEDSGLFGVVPVITSGYCDISYWNEYRKRHYGYDVIPFGFNNGTLYPVRWNRTSDGVLLANDYDSGYGNYVNIGLEV